MIYLFLLGLLAINASAKIASPVKVEVYIESMCPDSKAFILKQLNPTYSKLHSIIDLEILSFGDSNYTIINKTEEQFDVEFVCEHGPQECFGNQIQSCATSTLPKNASLAFINCMFESDNWKTPKKSGLECATSLTLDWSFLIHCASGPLGRGYELLVGEKTNKIKLLKENIPWITINGNFTGDIQTKAKSQLLKLVCDNYTGTKPNDCTE